MIEHITAGHGDGPPREGGCVWSDEPPIIHIYPKPMTDEIKPALTAEEWAHPSSAQQIGWACHEVFVGEGSSLDTVDRHGLAALCLHGQPFGFTREDVEALTVLIQWGTFSLSAQPEGRPPTVEERVRARDAIAKIAALLPPEPVTTKADEWRCTGCGRETALLAQMGGDVHLCPDCVARRSPY